MKRFELKMSQAELTAKLGWKGRNAQYISNVELSKCSFPPKSVVKLANALNVTTDEIINIMVQDYNLNLLTEVRGF